MQQWQIKHCRSRSSFRLNLLWKHESFEWKCCSEATVAVWKLLEALVRVFLFFKCLLWETCESLDRLYELLVWIKLHIGMKNLLGSTRTFSLPQNNKSSCITACRKFSTYRLQYRDLVFVPDDNIDRLSGATLRIYWLKLAECESSKTFKTHLRKFYIS